MKKLIPLFILNTVACAPPQEKISDAEVIKIVEGFFDALDVENTNPELLNDYVTDDFIIYEAGKKFTKDEFLELISRSPLTESDWELSDFRISVDNNSAHASFFNKGRFVIKTDSSENVLNFEWLESSYLVKEGDKLKIKFYFSDNITPKPEAMD
jgi:Domain of unknown function (DUF4440)